MSGVGSVQNGLVQIRPFASPVPARTVGIAWRHRYPREKTIRNLAKIILAKIILANLPAVVQSVSRPAVAA
jgi:hypothetical protein